MDNIYINIVPAERRAKRSLSYAEAQPMLTERSDVNWTKLIDIALSEVVGLGDNDYICTTKPSYS